MSPGETAASAAAGESARDFVLDLTRPITAQVHESVRRAIVTGRLAPGAAVSEKDLAARFGISRTPCREALIGLAREGLVAIYPQRGTVVAPIDPAGVAQAQFIREALEVAVVVELAGSSGRLDLSGLKTLLLRQKGVAASADYETFFELDEAFHRDLCALAGREPVWPLVSGVKTQLDRVRYLSLPDPQRIAEILDEHARIVAGVERKDPARAEQAMRQHLQAVLRSAETITASHAA